MKLAFNICFVPQFCTGPLTRFVIEMNKYQTFSDVNVVSADLMKQPLLPGVGSRFGPDQIEELGLDA